MINLLLVSFWLWVGIIVAMVFFKAEVNSETLRLLLFITLLLVGVEMDFNERVKQVELELKKKIRMWCGGYFEDD